MAGEGRFGEAAYLKSGRLKADARTALRTYSDLEPQFHLRPDGDGHASLCANPLETLIQNDIL